MIIGLLHIVMQSLQTHFTDVSNNIKKPEIEQQF